MSMRTTMVVLLAPFAPHICEELWQRMGSREESIIRVPWPQYDQAALARDTVQIVAQVNGKLRGKFDVPAEMTGDQIKEFVLADRKIQEFVRNKPLKKFIYVPRKLVNFVI